MELLREGLLSLASIFMRYRIGIGTYIRVKAQDRDRLPPPPFMVCSNHASHIDYVAVVEALGISHDDIIAIAAEDFHFDRSLRAGIVQRLFNLAPLERGKSLVSVRRCSEICQRFIGNGGKVILVYPEGTRSNDGRINIFKHGFAPIAATLGVPVVPAFIEGSFRIFSKHHVVPRPGAMTVRFGPAIHFDSAGGEEALARFTSADARALAAQVEQSVRALAGEAGASRKR